MKGVCRVKFYVSDDADGKRQLAAWMEGIEEPYTTAVLGEDDWAHSWQKYYHPMEIGEKLYIVPEWLKQTPVPGGRTAVYLNPGLTFGTGSHASTQLWPGGGGALYRPRRAGAGSGLRQRDSLHRRPAPGGGTGGGRGHRPQSGGCGL